MDDDSGVRKLIGDALIVNLTASKITAGTLSADVLLASKFYTDVSPNARVELDGLGLRAYDDTNKKTIDISSLDGHGVFEDISIGGRSDFGLKDPVTGEGSAQINAEGNASFQNLFVAGLYVNGDSVQDFLNEIGQGVIARSTKTLASNRTATGSTQEDLYEISCEVVAGRVYRINVDPLPLLSSPAGEAGGYHMYWTTDGSRPTQASSLFGRSYVYCPTVNPDTTVDFAKTWVSTTTGTTRFLLSLVHATAGTSDYVRLESGREIRITIEDLGTEPPDTGINPGDTLAQTKTFTYNFGWSADYAYTTGVRQGTGRFATEGQVIAGPTTQYTIYGLLGLTTAQQSQIASDLAGYTMNSVKLYMWCDYSNEGVPGGYGNLYRTPSISVWTHALTDNAAPATGPLSPSAASPVDGGLNFWKVVGGYYAEALPLSVGNSFRDGTAKGFRLMTTPGLNAKAVGYAQRAEFFGAGHASKMPYLKINATKY